MLAAGLTNEDGSMMAPGAAWGTWQHGAQSCQCSSARQLANWAAAQPRALEVGARAAGIAAKGVGAHRTWAAWTWACNVGAGDPGASTGAQGLPCRLSCRVSCLSILLAICVNLCGLGHAVPIWGIFRVLGWPLQGQGRPKPKGGEGRWSATAD